MTLKRSAYQTAGRLLECRDLQVGVVIESMYDDETDGFGATIRTLAMAVGLILLIACVNVAGLTLVRGATRDAELAIRAAVRRGPRTVVPAVAARNPHHVLRSLADALRKAPEVVSAGAIDQHALNGDGLIRRAGRP